MSAKAAGMSPAPEGQAEDREGDGQDERDGDVARGDGRICVRHRADRAGEADDGERVEEVGADDVADGEVVRPLARGGDGRGQLRQGRPDRDDGEPDHEVAHAERLRELDRAPHEDARRDDEDDEPGDRPERRRAPR